MNAIDSFVEWFSALPEGEKEFLSFQYVTMSRLYESIPSPLMSDSNEFQKQFIKWLQEDRTSISQAGIALDLRSKISFLYRKKGDLDSSLDTLNKHKRWIEQGEKDGINVDYLKKYVKEFSEIFDREKTVKESWNTFCTEVFSDEAIERLLFEDLTTKK